MDSQIHKSHPNDKNLEGNLNEMEAKANTEADNLSANLKKNELVGNESGQDITVSIQSQNSDKKNQMQNSSSKKPSNQVSADLHIKVEQNLLQKNLGQTPEEKKKRLAFLNDLIKAYIAQKDKLHAQFINDPMNKQKIKGTMKITIQKVFNTVISSDHLQYGNLISQIKSESMKEQKEFFEYFFLKQAEKQPQNPFFKDILEKSYRKKIKLSNEKKSNQQIQLRYFLVKETFLDYVRKFIQGYENYKDIKIQKQIQEEQEKLKKDHVCYHKNLFFSAYCKTEKRMKQIDELKKILPNIRLNKRKNIEKDCKFIGDTIKKISQDSNLGGEFNKYVNKMDQLKLWKVNKNSSQNLIIPFQVKKNHNQLMNAFKFSANTFAIFNFYPQTLEIDESIKIYQWLHILATSLGGRPSIENGIIGSRQFNEIMAIYQSLILTLIANKIPIKYILTATNIEQKQKNQILLKIGCCATDLKIQLKLIIEDQLVQLKNFQYNPFEKISYLKIEEALVRRCLQHFHPVSPEPLNIQLTQKFKLEKEQENDKEHNEDDKDNEDNKGEGEINEMDEFDLESIRLRRYAQYIKMINIFESNVNGNVLKLFNVETEIIIKTNFIKQNSQQSTYYKIIAKDLEFLNKLFSVQIFTSQWLSKIGLSEISLQLQSNLLGIIFKVKTKEIQPSENLKEILKEIFNFQSSVLIFQGGFIVFPNFLQKIQLPTYYSLRAMIQDSKQLVNQNFGLSYSFSEIQLGLEYYPKQKKTNWKIIAGLLLRKLAKNDIKLKITFMVDNGMKILNGKTSEVITNLFNIQDFNVEALELDLNFSTQEIFFMFDIQIEKIDIYFETSYQKSLINFKTSLQDLNIQDIFHIIKKFTKNQISLGHELKIQTIGLQINYKRDSQKYQFDSIVKVTFDSNDFEGQMSYKEQQFKLITKSNQIVIMDIQLKDTTLTISKKDKEAEIKYSGKLDYKSLSGQLLAIDSVVDLQINKDNKNKYEYSVIAEINLSQEPSLISKLNILDLEKIIFGLQSSQYHSSNGNIKGKYLSIQTGEFNLLNKKTTFSITLNLTNLQFEAAANFQREKKTGFLQLTKLAFDCKFSDQSVKFQGDFACPNDEDISFAGAVLFQQSKLGIDLKMFGIYRPTSYIQVGFDKKQQDKFTEVKVATNGQLFDLTISGRIKIYDFEASGNFQIIDDVPTHIQMNIQNLNISKMIDFVSQLFNENSKQKKVNVKFDENEQIILKNLYFLYNMNPLDIEGKLLLEFYGNTLEAELKFNPQQIHIKGKFEKPINIGPLYICGKEKGEGAGMQLLLDGLNSRFKLDCSLLIGPFSIDADLEISKDIIEFSVKVDFFGTQFIGYFKLDYKNQLCMFRLQFSTDQKEQNTQKDKVNHYINDNITNSKQQKFSLKQKPSPNIMMEQQPNIIRYPPYIIQQDQDLFYTAQTHDTRKKLISDYAEKSQVTRKQTQLINSMGEKIFTKQYFILQKQQQEQFVKQHKQKLKGTEQLGKKVRQLNNYKEFLVKQKGRSLSKDDQIKLQESKAQLKQLKQSKTKILKNIKQNKGLTEINQKLSDFSDAVFKKKNNPALRGFFSSLWNFAKNVYNFVAKVVTKVVQVTIQILKAILPIVTKFLIEGDVHKQEGSWKCGFKCTIQFTFFETKHSINFHWGDTFQHEQIQHKSIMEMTNYSLAYVKSTYLIPKQIAQKYHNSDQMHQDLAKNKLIGLIHRYASHSKKITIHLYTQLKLPAYSFTLTQKPTIMDLNIQKSLQKSSDYKYGFSKKLTYYQVESEQFYTYKLITLNTYFAGGNSHTPQIFLRFFEKQDLLKIFSPQQSNDIFNNIPPAQFLKRQEKEIDSKNYSVYSYIEHETKKEMKLCYLDTNVTNVNFNVYMKQQVDEPKQGYYWYQLEPIPKTNLQLPQVPASISKKFFS